jgi:hypothetical protein
LLFDDALASLDVSALREVVKEIEPWLDERTHARLLNALVERAVRGPARWRPAAPDDAMISKIARFAETAVRAAEAAPAEVDEHLRQGTAAFLNKDYAGAFRIFRCLLVPIGDGDIYLGHHEMVDEALGVDLLACAAQHVVSMYMTSVPARRARAVLSALDEMRGVHHFWKPLEEMERVAVEPLPEFADFLPAWREAVEERIRGERRSQWDSEEDRWLREVAWRLEGVGGLAAIARTSKRRDDLNAWCEALIEAQDWSAAFTAHQEAADLTDNPSSRGDFLDGVAHAARKMGRTDLTAHLKRAWFEAPSMNRLAQWLSEGSGQAELRHRAAEALGRCPDQAHRQRALLHVLLGDSPAAARLLEAAPGFGWSYDEHPGPLLFPLFLRVLGGVAEAAAAGAEPNVPSDLAETDNPHAVLRQAWDLVGLASLSRPSESDRALVLEAMRAAAARRAADVTSSKRRRRYGHAASAIAVCMRLDPSPEASAWLGAIREQYRRFPAFMEELARHIGS